MIVCALKAKDIVTLVAMYAFPNAATVIQFALLANITIAKVANMFLFATLASPAAIATDLSSMIRGNRA